MKWALKTERLSLHKLTEEDFNFIIKLETQSEGYKYEMEEVPEKLIKDTFQLNNDTY